MFFWVILLAGMSADPNIELIHKLNKMFGVSTTKIEIEVLSQEKLQKIYRDREVKSCVELTQGNLLYCNNYVDSMRFFILGMWIPEDDPRHLHIRLYKRAGVEVLIHEYLHWWLSYRTNPTGIINSEETVKTLTDQIMVSQEFLNWLKEDK